MEQMGNRHGVRRRKRTVQRRGGARRFIFPGSTARDGNPFIDGGVTPPPRSVCLQLPGAMMEELRVQALRMGVPQQSLLKVYLAERIEREMRRERAE